MMRGAEPVGAAALAVAIKTAVKVENSFMETINSSVRLVGFFKRVCVARCPFAFEDT
jgi:hypothetical protein